ncbi:SPOSA6832_03050 [Sporobolomyces salmonicolor]|uniref:SPOSA6832_03050-mRNA-1:cds n=1 Tax=Sporidiobolus salmonicolor TaxID=5005 RepID=A0A0D6EMT3_SPOSA|nr:SPOSA6832_03050 [Sporobolomyces salmonicolor]
MIRSKETGQLEPASWDDALNLIVKKSKELIKHYTPHSIAFYTSGQLFLEEYHTLAMIGKAGLGTLHMDGNTRLCTATAASAMRESFGCDGQPGSYTDIDFADCIFLVGHNMAATQTVLWSRILDRLSGPSPPLIISMDPRQTSVGHAAEDSGGIHLPLRAGTNLAMLNGLLHIILGNDEYHDKEYIAKHTIGIDELRATVESYTPERVSEITGVSVELIMRAGEALGKSKRLLSTALQGVYQSSQATASACAINNINLVKGSIGKPGGGVFQMNGQPTAQNNRECGCNGEYPGFRNPSNPDHMQDLADHWNIDVNTIPNWGQPTHIMSLLKFIENGSVKIPAVSLPELSRIRQTFAGKDLFVVAQFFSTQYLRLTGSNSSCCLEDIFPNETTALADVVLPAAQWSEKTGSWLMSDPLAGFTNVDRTVHIAYTAVDPPGEAWSDLKIFAEYAHRMGFLDKDGNDLIHWRDEPEKAFEHWKRSTKGRPVDYTGLSYEKLTGGSGIQWPCNDEYPDGKERLFTDGQFPTTLDMVESYGHDLFTGTTISPEAYKAMNPNGRAILKSCHWHPQEELVSDAHPYRLTTGRVVHHVRLLSVALSLPPINAASRSQFHTRTKTGRSKRLEDAAPEAFVQISEEDAAELDIKNGDMIIVENRRGALELPAKVGEIAKGNIFIPFHYGAADQDDADGKPVRARAANELTESSWDFVSKQPAFKGGSANIRKAEPGVQIHVVSQQYQAQLDKAANVQKHRAQDHRKEEHHRHLEDVLGELFHKICSEHTGKMQPFVDRYGECEKQAKTDMEGLMKALYPKKRFGSKPLNSLSTLLQMLVGHLNNLYPAAQALHDQEFASAVHGAMAVYTTARSWTEDQNKVAAPQVLIVPVKLENEIERDVAPGKTE